MNSDTVTRILTAAEARARSGGYNAFSFREISKEVGIKSASIHYHFPTKQDLSVALAQHYRQRFMAQLDEITHSSQRLAEQLERYAGLFLNALKVDQKMCLCGIFAAEMDVLPEGVRQETKAFFKDNLKWLECLLNAHHIPHPDRRAAQILANLEGAMLLAKAMESDQYFDRALDVNRWL